MSQIKSWRGQIIGDTTHRYWVVFGSDGSDRQGPYLQIVREPNGNICHLEGTAETLAEAAELRKTAGDLIFDMTTKTIVEDPSWLWSWEKERSNCYAQNKIRQKVRLVLDGCLLNRYKREDEDLVKQIFRAERQGAIPPNFVDDRALPLSEVLEHLPCS